MLYSSRSSSQMAWFGFDSNSIFYTLYAVWVCDCLQEFRSVCLCCPPPHPAVALDSCCLCCRFHRSFVITNCCCFVDCRYLWNYCCLPGWSSSKNFDYYFDIQVLYCRFFSIFLLQDIQCSQHLYYRIPQVILLIARTFLCLFQ